MTRRAAPVAILLLLAAASCAPQADSQDAKLARARQGDVDAQYALAQELVMATMMPGGMDPPPDRYRAAIWCAVIQHTKPGAHAAQCARLTQGATPEERRSADIVAATHLGEIDGAASR